MGKKKVLETNLTPNDRAKTGKDHAEPIKGFGKTEIYQLYDFLVAYEDSGIGRDKNSTKKLLQIHPELSGLLENFKKVQYHKSNNEEMQSLRFKELRNEIFLTKNKANLQLSFLAHLRNAIAHGHVIEHNKKVLVTDFQVKRPVNFSARGCIDLEVINEFTSTLKNIEL